MLAVLDGLLEWNRLSGAYGFEGVAAFGIVFDLIDLDGQEEEEGDTMIKGILTPVIVIILSSIAFVLSHKTSHAIEIIIGFALIAGFMPMIFLICFPVLMIPHFVDQKIGFIFTFISFLAAGFATNYVSKQNWAVKDDEATRVGVILFAGILVNSYIAFSVRSRNGKLTFEELPSDRLG